MSMYRLSFCGVTVKSCTHLSSALSSSHLRQLDLSYNYLQDHGVELISAHLADPLCKLEQLRYRFQGYSIFQVACSVFCNQRAEDQNSGQRGVLLKHRLTCERCCIFLEKIQTSCAVSFIPPSLITNSVLLLLVCIQKCSPRIFWAVLAQTAHIPCPQPRLVYKLEHSHHLSPQNCCYIFAKRAPLKQQGRFLKTLKSVPQGLDIGFLFLSMIINNGMNTAKVHLLCRRHHALFH